MQEMDELAAREMNGAATRREMSGAALRQEAGASGRKRVETVLETLTALGGQGESLSELAHDARNMVTALSLYCDLLEEPGVLAIPFSHYGQELRLVAAASRRLVEKLVALDGRRALAAVPTGAGDAAESWRGADSSSFGAANIKEQVEKTGRERLPSRRLDLFPGAPIRNLAAELLANRNLLSALAGPGIALTVHAEGGAQPVALTAEDLTRVLVNLVKNAAEAMPAGGRIHIGLSERPASGGAAASAALAVEDNGPGIPADALEAIFDPGFTTHRGNERQDRNLPLLHRGLGLAITRSIVEGAGGRIAAANREPRGTRIEIELPVREGSR
jgi:signal transduction histidine kinase